MHLYRDNIKKDFGGQALNRYERVCALLARYMKIYGKPDNRLIELCSDAIFDEKQMHRLLKMMPRKVPIHKRNKSMTR